MDVFSFHMKQEEMVQKVSPFMEGPLREDKNKTVGGETRACGWGKEGSKCGGSTAVVSVGMRREGQEQMGPASTND